MEEQNYYNMKSDELYDEITIDIKKLFLMLWSRKILIIKVFVCTLIFFIALTYILPKKWKVDADLYINKTNNTNMIDVNPYVIEESGMASMLAGNSSNLMNEIELMSSPLVINKVIEENDIRFKKLFGLFPTVKTGELMTTEKFLKKVKIEAKKGTNVVSISYKNKDRDLSYNVVVSIITHYIDLRKELMSEKSKSDKKVIETEYQKAKADLNKKVSVAGGLPTTSMSGSSNLAAMSAFSRSAQGAMATLKGQYLAGEKARVEINEEASKVNQLAQKLEWAKLVEEMSDSSKVLVIKEPHHLKDWEFASPKLFINILLGILFGIIFSLAAVIIAEIRDKKLSYSMLGDNIIYNLDKETKPFYAYLLTNKNKQILFAFCGDIPISLNEKFKLFSNISIVQAAISDSFSTAIQNSDQVIMFAQIGKTVSEDYKILKNMIKDNNKEIAYEVLV